MSWRISGLEGLSEMVCGWGRVSLSAFRQHLASRIEELVCQMRPYRIRLTVTPAAAAMSGQPAPLGR
jgi:hypothetical protein